MARIYFRHDKARPFQQELLEETYNTVHSKDVLLAHAPTGTGKTDAVLGAALTAALESGLTVFFLTPKISQHRIAIEVAKGIAEKYKLDFHATDIVGRKHACMDGSLAELDADAFYMRCEKLRKTRACTYYGNARGYSKLGEALAGGRFKKILEEYGTAMPHAWLMKLGIRHACCPYELSLRLATQSELIIADYMHFFIPAIRGPLLAKAKKQIGRSIVIVDEAHNLAKRVREHLSSSLNSFMLKRAEKEMSFLGVERMPLAGPFAEWAALRLKKESEGIVSKLGFDNFLSSFGIEPGLLAAYLEELGIRFIEKTGRRSTCLRLSAFIRTWNIEEEGCIRVLRRSQHTGNVFFSLSKRMLDPSIATKVLNEAHAAVLMSGTMKPMEMHMDVLGLEHARTRMRAYPSPFSQENKRNIITERFTTKFTRREPGNYSAMARSIDEIISSTPGGVALFFASYPVQNAIVRLMKSKNLLLQQENMRPDEIDFLLSEFRKGSGVLCGVQGGSLAEGIDYPNGEIKTIVVVGVALDEKNIEVDALIDYYEGKFGRGWEYGYIFPAVIKGMQAAGRGIRKENDRCAVVLMDERFKWKKYRDILDSEERYIVATEPERHVREFWREQDKVVAH